LKNVIGFPALLFLGIFLTGAQNQQVVSATHVRRLATSGTNAFYTGNRAPLRQSALMKLPIGSVRPDGWLGRQMELEAEGFTGHLSEVSKFCKFQGSAWTNPSGEGALGWEEVPYWLKGFVDLGYVLHNKRIVAESQRWIEQILATQRADGYFGPRGNLTAKGPDGKPMIDLWPNMIMMYPLRTYYEATGDRRVIQLLTKYFAWQRTIAREKFLPASWQKWRGGENLDSIYWLYNRTGESALLELAKMNHERTSDWTHTIPTWHGVNITECFREPATWFQQSKDENDFAATVHDYETVMNTYGQVPGGMFGADENARPGYTSPRQAAETCSMAEFMHSDEVLTRISGDAVWADRAEDVAFNSLPASMTPDLKGLHYLTAPNMIQLDRGNKAPMIENDGDMLSYNPYQYRCCQHNVAFAWPYFAEHLFMATPGNGLAAVLYAPSAVTARAGDGSQVEVRESTNYPFDDDVSFTFKTERDVKLPLTIRVPGWSGEPSLQLNGAPVHVENAGPGWLIVDRTWQSGDNLTARFPMHTKVTTWAKNSVSISRGPLSYSLKISEKWQSYGEQKWAAYEVYPASTWNYGLVIDPKNPESSVRVKRTSSQLAGQPFAVDSAPIELKAKARRISNWTAEQNGFVGLLPDKPATEGAAEEEITLVPMGCARLRISVFPVVE
jgi:DUF1680 family protein